MNVFAGTPAARLRTLRSALALSAAALAAVGLSACGSEPAPAAPATTAPAAVTSAVTTAAPASNSDRPTAPLAGTRYYLEITGSDARVHAVRPGNHDVSVLPLGNGSCVANSMTVSPDGKRIAWVQNGDDSGTLMTAAIDGSQRRTLGKGINCLGPRALVWQGGDRLMVGKGNVSVLFDMMAGKPFDGDPGQETDRCWSADGKWLAALDDSGKPFVTTGNGGHKYSYTPPKDEAAQHDGWQARSVSMDGQYVAVGWKGTHPSRQDGSFGVVNTTTSKVVDLPGADEVRSIQFAADGKVLVRQADRIAVLDARFRQLGEVAESPDVQKLTLLTYVP